MASWVVVCSPAGAQQPAVSAYPSPGTVTASPWGQISFRGVPLGEIGRIHVRGSRSGARAGRLRAHSDGQGASFVPREPFRAGETVTVRTRLAIRNAKGGDFRFRTARVPGTVRISAVPLETVDAGKRHAFRSRPDLEPPIVTVDSRAPAATPGHIVLSPKPKSDRTQAGPMIVDNSGGLVYFRPLGGRLAATDVRVQRYRGRPVLTWWQGTSRQGIGNGHFVIVDESYRVVKRVQVPGYRADLHEFLITPRDTALVIAYPVVPLNLAAVGGSRRGRVVDSVIQEIDLETGLMLFEWHSVGKVPLRDSYQPLPASFRNPYDYFHANSVSLDTDGDFLVSAASTWAVYKIDRATGAIEWRLGGKRSTFRMDTGTRFSRQHDARRRADGALTLFDNSVSPTARRRSRAIALRLDERARKATLVSAAFHPRRLVAITQGNHQTLPNGHFMVGWGSQRYFTEFAADGRIVWHGRLAVGYETYRAYRASWTGRPHTRPRTAGTRRRGGGMDVYASWNGATEVATWEVLAGPSPSALQPAGSAPRSGFETRITLGTRAAFVAVRARDAAGRVLGTSPAERVRTPD